MATVAKLDWMATIKFIGQHFGGQHGRVRWRVMALLAAAILAGCGRSAPPPSTLLIPINLKCTTCDDFIRCRRQDAAPNPETGRTPEIVYRLKEKSFWAQIATIGDYLVQIFRTKTSDQRPLAIYRDDGVTRHIETDPHWFAHIDAVAADVSVLDARIDARTGAWHTQRGVLLGSCHVMKRREGYALVREFLGRPALPTP